MKADTAIWSCDLSNDGKLLADCRKQTQYKAIMKLTILNGMASSQTCFIKTLDDANQREVQQSELVIIWLILLNEIKRNRSRYISIW